MRCGRHEGLRFKLQLHFIHCEELLELTDDAVLGTRENLDQDLTIERFETDYYGNATDKFRDQAVLKQVVGHGLLEQAALIASFFFEAADFQFTLALGQAFWKR